MRSARLWHYLQYDLIGTADSYVFGFFRRPELSAEPVPLRCGSPDLEPGQRLSFIGGHRTSAGLPNLHGERLCFDACNDGSRIPVETVDPAYAAAYFGFVYFRKFRQLFFANQAGSGRIVETTTVRRLRPAEITARNREPART